jgi:putative hydrolase of the HAD superfamily
VSDLEPSEVEDRRAARERALELLYEAEIKGSGIDDVLAALPVAPAALAVELVRGVEAHAQRIDEILAQRVAPKWTLTRLAALDRAVLRLGIYELLDRPDRSRAVIINEAVILARRFGTDDSPRFVNGVLSAVAAELRRDEGPDGLPPAATDVVPVTDVAPIADADVVPVTPAETEDEAENGVGGADLDSQVEALIIDFDGVIRQWDEGSLAEAEADLGLPAGVIAVAAFDPVRFEPAMLGELSHEAWCVSVGEAVAAAHGVAADAVGKAFAETRWDLDNEVLDLVERVRRRVPVALLSNASSRLVDDLRQAGVADRFDTIVGSAALGRCKPDAVAFLAAADRLGVPPAQCLMVDDLADNVDGARAAGMQAVRFTDAASLAEALAAAGLLDPAQP